MNRHVWLGFLAFTAVLQAQVTGTITGRVEDPSGAPVPAATITVKSLETGATRVVTADQSGNYRALSLPLGAQEVTAEKSGFKEAIRTGIDLVVGQNAVVNFRLEVGELPQQVTVTENVSLVDTTNASISGLVSERQIKDLPLNGRSFDNLISLNPGAINYSAMKSSGTTTSNGNTFSVDGRRTSENLFLSERHRIHRFQPAGHHTRRSQQRAAGHRRHPRVQRPDQQLRRRIWQAGRRAGRRSDAIGHQRPARYRF